MPNLRTNTSRVQSRSPWTRSWRLLAVLLLSSVACANATTMPRFSEDDHAVLFIGNSLTYTNDLPAMVVALARQAGDTKLQVASIAKPDFALEDHWNDGEAPAQLRARRWNHVVMQQGSSALPASQQHLRTWTERFGPLVKASGAEPVLLAVWPTQGRLFDFPNVAQSYKQAAASVDGLYAPAGDAWTRYGNYNELYSDGLHPTPMGTYLAALVVLERIRGIRPDQLPQVIPGYPIPENTVRRLQEAAMLSLQQNERKPGRLEVPR